jgi:hypothetical protein
MGQVPDQSEQRIQQQMPGNGLGGNPVGQVPGQSGQRIQQQLPGNGLGGNPGWQVPGQSGQHAQQQQLQGGQIDGQQEDTLVELAVDAIRSAIMRVTNGDINKTDAAMNLIGAGAEMPQIVGAVCNVVAEQFDPAILSKACAVIAKRYKDRSTLISESLTKLYGPEGHKLIRWEKMSK